MISSNILFHIHGRLFRRTHAIAELALSHDIPVLVANANQEANLKKRGVKTISVHDILGRNGAFLVDHPTYETLIGNLDSRDETITSLPSQIEQLKKERDEARAELNEVWVDGNGTTGAYAAACKAEDKHAAENARLRAALGEVQRTLDDYERERALIHHCRPLATSCACLRSLSNKL